MATIQVRDISEDAYEILRRRARRAGQSIQAYMKQQIERLASEPDDDELFAAIERYVADHGIDVARARLEADLDADRR